MKADHGLGVRTALEASDRSPCDNPDAIGSLHIKHLHEEDFLDTETIILPTKHNADKTKLKYIKKRFSILENHIVSSVEAYGACFCWKIYSDTKFRGEVQQVSEGDEIEVEHNVGSIENLDAQNQIRMITTNIAVIYINCSLS